MSRLTIRKNDIALIEEIEYEPCGEVCDRTSCFDCPIGKVVEKLAHYEDLEEQGRLIEVVTCKECKYYKKDTSNINNPCGYCEIIPAVRYENEYCSLAERKMDEVENE